MQQPQSKTCRRYYGAAAGEPALDIRDNVVRDIPVGLFAAVVDRQGVAALTAQADRCCTHRTLVRVYPARAVRAGADPIVVQTRGLVRPRIVDIIQKLHGGRQDGAGVGELGRHLEGQISLRTERVDCTSCAAGVSPTVIKVASSSTVIFAEIGQKRE